MALQEEVEELAAPDFLSPPGKDAFIPAPERKSNANFSIDRGAEL